MKLLKHLPSYLLCVMLWTSCLLSGCKRDIPPLPIGELRNVTFKLEGFEAETVPMGGMPGPDRLALGVTNKRSQALKNIEPGLTPQYLYYWSFNEENLEPDRAIDEAGARITFDATAEAPDFPNSTFGFDSYEGGQAFSLRGGRVVELELALAGVESLSEFAFDISSSGTGPKAFSLSYSVDGGTTYLPIVESKQFDDLGDQKRNSYLYDLAAISYEVTTGLRLKFEFFAGNREGADEYNESQGTVRLDNIRLSGVYNGPGSDLTTPTTLHYYIFSSEDGSVVQQQQLSMAALGDEGRLDMKLAEGNYDVLFVAYRSDKGVLLPANLTNANEFYFGQHFDDYRAVTYAALLNDVTVGDADIEEVARLSRCYSLVEFDFTDSEADLRRVKKIEIVRKHDDFLYTPFGMPPSGDVTDAQRIIFNSFEDINDYKISLHQFFGLLNEGKAVSYELTAYGEGAVVLNKITITEALHNNVRLRLTGTLLGDSGANSGLSVVLDTAWEQTLAHEF